MGAFHFLQGILMILLSNDFSLPVTTFYLSSDLTTKSISTVKGEMFQLRIGPMVAAFLFISSTAHFLVSTVFYKW